MKHFLAALCLLLAGGLDGARAHVPVPDSVLNPRTAPEAWNVLRLATANTARLLDENRLAEIPDQISLCGPALRLLSAVAVPGQQTAVEAGVVRAVTTIGSLAQGSLAGDRPLAVLSLATLQADLHGLAASFDPQTVAADVFVCPMHPDVTSTDLHARCEHCGMPLIVRRIPYSFVYTPPGEPTLRLTARAAPLRAGQATPVTIRLAHADGAPVLPDDLQVVHTQPIHLLVVDAGLRDYHHEHPVPTGTPGEYTFSFTPQQDCRYRVFADLVPTATSAQEYPFADLPGISPVVTPGDRTPNPEATAGGLHFHLTWEPDDGPLVRANQPRQLRITITDPAGQPVITLEPFMAAFAHLVGFYDDGRTVVHFHPLGSEVADLTQRGSPTLLCRFYPPKAGLLRLFFQVQVNGQSVYAPFNVVVAP